MAWRCSMPFADYGGQGLDGRTVRHQLGGMFLRKFAIATCGVALWQPASPREAALIDAGIQRALQALHYWYEHDPALFDFLA